MLAKGSRLLGPLLSLGCTFSPFLFSLEDLHCLFEACYLSSGFFSICIVLMILVVWSSLSWLVRRVFGLDFISFLLSGGSGVLSHRACSGDILFSVWFLITETQNTFRFRWPYIAARWKRVIHYFSDIASRLAPCSDLYFFCN